MAERIRRWDALTEVGSIVVAMSILSAIAIRRHLPSLSADGVVPVLISTYRFTAFYWDQDRLASLVPLVASPVQDEIWNLKLQAIVMAFGFFSLPAMFAWFHLHVRELARRPTTIAITTLIAGLLVMLPMERNTGYAFILEQPYTLSMALFLSGCWLLVSGSPMRIVFGFVLLLAATALNPASVLMTPVVWLLIEGEQSRLRRLAVAAGATVSAFVLAIVLGRALNDSPSPSNPYNDFSIGRALHGMWPAARMIGSSMWEVRSALLILVLVVGMAALWGDFPHRLRAAYLSAIVFSAAWFVVFSGNRWVEINRHYFRYYFPLYTTFVLAASGLTAELITRVQTRGHEHGSAPPSRQPATAVAWLAAAVVALAILPVAVRKLDLPVLDHAAVAVEAAEAEATDMIVGDYWSVWPAVLLARSEGLDLIGVSDRSWVIIDEIEERTADRSAQDPLTVVCLEPEPQTCADYVSYFTNRAWVVGTTQGTSPMIVDLYPAE